MDERDVKLFNSRAYEAAKRSISSVNYSKRGEVTKAINLIIIAIGLIDQLPAIPRFNLLHREIWLLYAKYLYRKGNFNQANMAKVESQHKNRGGGEILSIPLTRSRRDPAKLLNKTLAIERELFRLTKKELKNFRNM